MANKNLVKLIDKFITIETEPVNNSALWDIIDPDEKVRLLRTIIEAALYIETLGQNSITNKILDVVLELETSSVDLETGEVTTSKTYNIDDILSYPTGVLSWMIDNGKKEGNDGKPININSDGFLPREATFWIDAILRLGTYWFETGYTPSTRPKGDGDITFSDSPNSNVTWKKDENNIWMPNDVLAILRNSHFYIWTKNEIEYSKKRGFTGGFVTIQEFDALKKLVDEYSSGIGESVKTAKFKDETLTTTQRTKAEDIVSVEDKKIRILTETNKTDITNLDENKMNGIHGSIDWLSSFIAIDEKDHLFITNFRNTNLGGAGSKGDAVPYMKETRKRVGDLGIYVDEKKFNIFKKEGKTTIDYAPDFFVINDWDKLVSTDILNESLEGKKGVPFMLKTRKMVEGKINSFSDSNTLHQDTHMIKDGKIINSDFNNKQLNTKNKWGKGAINELLSMIEGNGQTIITHSNLLNLIFDILEVKTDAYVKSSNLGGTFYEPKYMATTKKEASHLNLIDQISTTEHKVFKGFSSTLGVGATIVINEAIKGDVEFTLYRDGKSISKPITKTLTGSAQEIEFVFNRYEFKDDKKDHIYMIGTQGVAGVWFNVSYINLEFTLIGAGGGTGGDVSMAFVVAENDRQDLYLEKKLEIIDGRFIDLTNNKMNAFNGHTDLDGKYFRSTLIGVIPNGFYSDLIGDAEDYMIENRKMAKKNVITDKSQAIDDNLDYILITDNVDILCIGMFDGYFAKYNSITDTYTNLTKQHKNINSLTFYNDELYIGMDNGYFAKYNSITDTYTTLTKQGNYIYSLAVYNNELYIGMFGAEFSKYNSITDTYTNLKSKNSESINSLTVYNNELYIGMTTGSFSKYNSITDTYTNLTKQHKNINSLAVYNNELYIGMFDGYFAKYNSITDTYTNLTKQGERINSLTVYNNELYIGMNTGSFSKYNSKTDTYTNLTKQGEMINSLTVYNNELYIGMNDGYFVKYNSITDTYTNLTKQDENIVSLAVYKVPPNQKLLEQRINGIWYSY